MSAAESVPTAAAAAASSTSSSVASSSAPPAASSSSSSALVDADVPVIRALSESVVNRIAAGEVIHRPSSALKELVENSLDARSTRIAVVIREGGLKSIQIADNGCGIRMSDFPILCERFTTSKLQEYSDLQSIATFGFRGEALASMTHVARVSITSMTRGSTCAYRASFNDGRMVDPDHPEQQQQDANTDIQPRPCAGVKGTTILIEDLFYNVPIRRNALKNANNEEYARCLDVLCKYAIHYSGQSAFSCKKHGTNKLDLNTIATASVQDNIRSIYGASIAKELLPLELKMDAAACSAKAIDSSELNITGYVSNANFSQKKLALVLFINHRLVDSSSIKRAIDGVYTKYLPKHTHPFVYLSLHMDPRILDVNVHPTKKEVHFLFEEQIVECLEQALENSLKGANKSRVFYTQSITAGQNAASILPPPISATSNAATSSNTTAALMTAVRGVQPSAAPIVTDEAAEPQPMQNEEDIVEISSESAAAADVKPPVPADTMVDDEEPPLIPPTVGTGVRSSSPPSSMPRLSPPSAASNSAPTATRAPAPASFFSSIRMGGSSQLSTSQSSGGNSQIRRDNHLVRVDNRQGKIDTFLSQPPPSQLEASRKRPREDELAKPVAAAEGDVQLLDADDEKQPANFGSKTRLRKLPTILLTSVQQLINNHVGRSHASLAEVFQNGIFVGFVDYAYSLMQHQTKLYLVNMERISESYFYEQILKFFGHHLLLRFEKPIPVKKMLLLALQHKDSTAASATAGLSPAERDHLAQEYTDFLAAKAAMLLEYFAIELTEKVTDGDSEGGVFLNGIPELLSQYNPPLILLPLFLLKLARDCNWTAEQECFATISRCLANFYRFQKPQLYLNDKLNGAAAASSSTGSASSSSNNLPQLSWVVPHVFFPLLRHRSYFTPPSVAATDGTVTQIASLENLYKIFERC